jgi:hypothetical protein
MRRLAPAIATAIAIALALPAGAAADISVRLSNAQMTAASDLIVVGRVAASQSRWIDRTLVTVVTVSIDETLKGGATGSIDVIVPGGVDLSRRIPIGMTFPGAPTLRTDESVFLFLTFADDLAGHVVTGFAQGKFSIVTDHAGVRRVSRDLRGSQLVEGTGVSRGTTTLEPLDIFREEILALVTPR